MLDFTKYKNTLEASTRILSKVDRVAYQKENDRLRDLFAEDLAKEYGVEDNPKKDKLFELAWEHGGGHYDVESLYDVESFYADVADLIV